MRPTPADQFRHEIERLERESALLSSDPQRRAPEIERRLIDIGAALDMLRADLERLGES